jgi:hypothetical protein
VLPKKDDKLDQVITHLKTTALAEMSVRYAQVRVRVVDYQLDAFSGIAALGPNMQASFSHNALDVGFVMNENFHIDNYGFAGVLTDDPMLGMVNGWETSIEWE